MTEENKVLRLSAEDKKEIAEMTLKLAVELAPQKSMTEALSYLRDETVKQAVKENQRAVSESFKQALKEHESEKRKQEKELKDKRFKNTELLIINYRKCKKMVEGLDLEKEDDDGTILSLEDITLENLEKFHYKTYKIIRHVDRMLAAYQWECNQGLPEEKRRWTILYRRYISDNRMTVNELMDYLNIGQSTVYSDTKKALKDLSVLVFGYDGVF